MPSRTHDVAAGASAPVARTTDPRARRITLVVNPAAGGGRGRRSAAEAASRLTARGMRVRTVETLDAEHAAQEARRAFDRGEVAVAVGGDGMLRILAGEAVRRDDAVVGLLPAGRGNDFARFLGLPTDHEAATETLASGVEALLDTGVARGSDGVDRTFLSIVSIGFDAEANRIANAAPPALGGLVYVVGAVGALAGLRPVPLRIVADGAERASTVLLLAVANSGAYGGGMHMAPHASLGDGVLDVVAVPHRGRPERCGWRDRLRILRFLPRVFRGSHVGTRYVELSTARTIRVEADGPLVAYADGDPIGVLPLTISTRPSSLRLLVPATGGLRPGVDRPSGVAA